MSFQPNYDQGYLILLFLVIRKELADPAAQAALISKHLYFVINDEWSLATVLVFGFSQRLPHNITLALLPAFPRRISKQNILNPAIMMT